MTEFENVVIGVLIVIYVCVFYMAGKANLLDLIVLMIQDKAKELQDRLKGYDDEMIRCKNCKWFGDIGCAIKIVDECDKPTENDFCSFAELKEELKRR